MKKTKRILALIGAILLLLLYVVAFVATVLDHTSDMRYWKAAVAATIIIPVLIWAYSFVYRLLKWIPPSGMGIGSSTSTAAAAT